MAEAEFRNVGRVEDIPPGTIRPFTVNEQEIAVANVGGEFFATQQHCRHLSGPVGEARLGNRVGCERQLEKARRRLATYAPAHRGVDIAALLVQLETAAKTVEAGSLELTPPVL